MYLLSFMLCLCSYLFLCAEHMWVHQKQWESLISRQQGVSEDMVRLMNCLSALVCRRLREKTLESRAAWKHLILSLKVGMSSTSLYQSLTWSIVSAGMLRGE